MKVVIGIDLGSTTSKALILDEDGNIVGRGLTNTRSNYDVAVDIARTEAVVEARFNFLEGRLREIEGLDTKIDSLLAGLSKEFRLAQYVEQLRDLRETILGYASAIKGPEHRSGATKVAEAILDTMQERARKHFRFGFSKASFFRDLASSDYMALAQEHSGRDRGSFDRLVNLFDKSIIQVENRGIDVSFEANIREPFATVVGRFAKGSESLRKQMENALTDVIQDELEIVGQVGTGYGRARLPFEKEQIRSEILCHGLGAHRMFPGTRTVLDIGGQDTKAIQVDPNGIVTSFQMNDRCAAGCGRYLGYIADEMNLGLHELGPLADKSSRATKISSTCTVFAGAELRDRLTMGEKREDILAGLHRAIILRAMSLLARSGGVRDEFTFTGGVANNSAAVRALRGLTEENYGALTLNISPDSIFTGALGAAIFAYRDILGEELAA